jgi:hypothetical protein
VRARYQFFFVTRAGKYPSVETKVPDWEKVVFDVNERKRPENRTQPLLVLPTIDAPDGHILAPLPESL